MGGGGGSHTLIRGFDKNTAVCELGRLIVEVTAAAVAALRTKNVPLPSSHSESVVGRSVETVAQFVSILKS